ncbi:peptidoglycan-binding protein [Streptomyces sp. NPDC000410]|uniref:peptidoglycan-binding protein n=1 Tax=Streptomyces sp. NPDC000410 TaxID=3154254 RepID=UPI003321F7EC
MTVPAFEEYEPPADCACAGCVQQRRALARAHAVPVRAGGHPAAHGARRALVLATAAGVALGGGGAGAATAAGGLVPGGPSRADDPGPSTPQGGQGPLYGRPTAGPSGSPSTPELRKTTRADIINRAKRWVTAKVPYSQSKFWSDGYRQDCSGYVSMAWNLPGNEWTGSLADYGVRIDKKDLQPGDILLFHNPDDPSAGSHVTIFGGWTDFTRTYYTAYEQSKPYTRKQATPLAYWSNSSSYVAYRYKGLVSGSAKGAAKGPAKGGAKGGAAKGTAAAKTAARTAFPGVRAFGPGAANRHITELGRMLVERGGKRFYREGPGPLWSAADRKATEAFQRAQGWRDAEADGLPGPHTWRHLVNGTGRNIPRAVTAGPPAAVSVPHYPGKGYFRPGQSNPHIEKLGRQLVKRGFGKHYTSGPDKRWTEADRRNVEAFQRAQGWRGGAADGYPGPETWRRLFS